MKIIIYIIVSAILYYLLITLVIKLSLLRKDEELVLITPPVKKTVVRNNSDSAILKAIARLLLNTDDILKSAKFIADQTSLEVKEFILEYLHDFNPELHDKILALNAVDLNEVEPFESKIIDVEEDYIAYTKNDLSPEEDILMGGVAFYKYKSDLNFEGISNYCEYFNKLETEFIARELSEIEKLEIEKSKIRILNIPVSSKKNSSTDQINKIFKAGIKTATSICNEAIKKKQEK